MSAPSSQPRPGLRFTWLGIVIGALVLLVGGGAIWSSATWAPKLALDLEGGTSIILEAEVEDSSQVTSEQLNQAVATIRQRVDSTGVSEAEISTQGDRNIVVSLPGNPDEETRELVRSSAQLGFRRVAFAGAPEPASAQEGADGAEEDPLGDLSEEERQRLEDLLGDEQPAEGEEAPAEGGGTVAQPAGGEAPAEEAPATEEEAPAEEESAPAEDGSGFSEGTPRFDPMTNTDWQSAEIMEAYAALDCTDPANRTGGDAGDPDGFMVACQQDGQAKYILGPLELDGSHVDDATFGFSTNVQGVQTNQVAVNLSFDGEGTEVFADMTRAITGQQQPYDQFAMVLDGLVISAPASNAYISDGNAEITGNFTLESAETMANQLKNGALPISFTVQSEEQVSPTLGADQLQKGLIAGGIGLVLVIIYSLAQYRVLGLVTISSLVVAGVITYLLLLLVTWRYGYRLSLAGVAGLIVGLVATADSFIVYFERIRDELRGGRRLTSAVEIGWDRAKRTIFASKGVNMLGAIILYVLSVGSVRGFAFTLGLTVIVDILIFILFTHPVMQVLARTRFFGEGHRMSGMDPRQLGVSQAAYRGALNLDLERAREAGGKKGGSYREAKRRQAQVDKRTAAAEAARTGSGTGTGRRSLAQRKAEEARAAAQSADEAAEQQTAEQQGTEQEDETR
ncbi:protein translocase subunit SecD [Brevibacterium album]|uniref:protein translocase subunit SecD n=1 Tax=Brevibacterium album TaxID=417948 RepID=UPI00041F22D5|nr:protein translocase subunit SecD [Brevibacterium album]